MKSRILTAALMAALLLSLACFIAAAATAGAQVIPPQPSPITDYASYPGNNGLPAGCDANGIFGAAYSVNGGAPVASLASIGELNAGDLVEMTWTGVADVCVSPDPGPIVLAMKSTETSRFDPTDDQSLDLPYAIAWLTNTGPGSLPFVLPPLNDDSFPGCNGQLDAIVGLPLAVVGPSGSYYATGVPWDMLIDAWNGGYPACEDVPVPTVPEVTTTVPTTVPEVTTTTVEDFAPTTTGPALNVTPAVETVAVAVQGVTVVAAYDENGSALAIQRTPLPVTGFPVGLATAVGSAVIALGGIALLAAHARNQRETV